VTGRWLAQAVELLVCLATVVSAAQGVEGMEGQLCLAKPGEAVVVGELMEMAEKLRGGALQRFQQLQHSAT